MSRVVGDRSLMHVMTSRSMAQEPHLNLLSTADLARAFAAWRLRKFWAKPFGDETPPRRIHSATTLGSPAPPNTESAERRR